MNKKPTTPINKPTRASVERLFRSLKRRVWNNPILNRARRELNTLEKKFRASAEYKKVMRKVDLEYDKQQANHKQVEALYMRFLAEGLTKEIAQLVAKTVKELGPDLEDY